jgi:hypothetical protein
MLITLIDIDENKRWVVDAIEKDGFYTCTAPSDLERSNQIIIANIDGTLLDKECYFDDEL